MCSAIPHEWTPYERWRATTSRVTTWQLTLGLVGYEIDEPLHSLHENGIIEQNDDGTWRLSRRVRTKPEGEYMEFELPDGSSLEMGLLPPRTADGL